MEDVLQAAVRDAAESGGRLVISSAGTKSRWVPRADGELLSVAELTGIVDYQPEELVITVRGGTLLKDVQQALSQRQQMLAFEPPMLAGGGTVGGAVAAGLSGPARPWRGSLSDATLGVRILNGQGDILRFGGQVMKNVAGYDVSRLMAGSWGALGVILDVSLRVQPRPDHAVVLAYEYDAQQAIEHCRSMARVATPVTACFWHDGKLLLRFEGSESALQVAAERFGGQRYSDVDVFRRVRDLEHDFFKPLGAGGNLYRIVTPPAAMVGPFENLAIEWGGGLRWVWHEDAATVFEYAKSVVGWAWRMGEAVSLTQFNPALAALNERVRNSFDPHNVFASPLLEPTERERR